MTCAPAVGDAAAITRNTFAVESYDLAATFTSGQTFRWKRAGRSWLGVIGPRWVRLESDGPLIHAEIVGAVADWTWLVDYLQCDLSLTDVIRTFPADAPMRAATEACHGLRLLRQDPWECLASFILSSTKQIVQIQQIVALLCETYGDPVPTPREYPPARRFPSAARLAEASEVELRACKMGFRAPYLRGTAQKIASGEVQLERLGQLPVDKARQELMALPGVGRKIADCVLLFAYGFQSAFPVDVWVMRALRELYFSGRRVKQPRLHRFSDQHFGPNAGYAQQYLFHYVRTKASRSSEPQRTRARARIIPGSA